MGFCVMTSSETVEKVQMGILANLASLKINYLQAIEDHKNAISRVFRQSLLKSYFWHFP